MFTSPQRIASAPVEREIYRVADSERGALTLRLASALRSSRSLASTAAVTTAIESRSASKVVKAISWPLFESSYTRAFLKSAIPLAAQGARVGAGEITSAAQRKHAERAFAVKADYVFDLKNAKSIEWIREYAGQHVEQITEISRDAIRSLVEMSFRDGIPPRALARMLRDYIGLDARFAMAAYKFERGLTSAGFAPDVIEKKAGDYAGRLLRARADRIARTETIRAANAGQKLLWKDAQANGLLGAGVVRVWISSGDACEICVGLDGETAGIDELFAGEYDQPPDPHPSCRCAMGIEFLYSAPSQVEIEVAEVAQSDVDRIADDLSDEIAA